MNSLPPTLVIVDIRTEILIFIRLHLWGQGRMPESNWEIDEKAQYQTTEFKGPK